MSGQTYKADGRSSLQIQLKTGSGVAWSTVGSGSGWIAELRPEGSPSVTNASATFNITVSGDTMTLTIADPSPLLRGSRTSYGWALYDGNGAPILTDMVVELHDGYTHPSGTPSPSAATEVGTYTVDLGTATGNLVTTTVWTGPQGPAGPAGPAGGGATINDTTPSTTTVYSSTKATSTWQTQSQVDARVRAVGDPIYAPHLGLGDRLRRALAHGYTPSTMTTPPTVTTATADPDTTLSKTVYIATNSSQFKYRGGTPTTYSVYYRFPVVTRGSGTGNSTATGDACGWAAEFYTDAPKMTVFVLNSSSPNGLQIEVDGQRIAATATAFPATSGSGFFLLDFTSAGGSKVRRIRVEGDVATGFRGVKIGPAYSAWAPEDTDRITAAVVGDSVTSQTGTSQPNGGFAIEAGKRLGWTDVREVALGGSGYTAPGPSNSTFGSSLRVADTVACAPDVLVISGGTNDGAATTSDITAAALACFQAYRAALPDVPIIVGGAWPGATGPSATSIAVENAIKAGFDSWGDSNSFFIPLCTDPQGSWLTGTGHVGATNGSGNADIYVISDGTHPNQAGHDYYASRMANAIRTSVLPLIP